MQLNHPSCFPRLLALVLTLALFLTLGLTPATHAASSPPKITITDLGTLGGKTSIATDINNKGQVVGWSYDEQNLQRAFLWQNGVMTDLGVLGGSYSAALAINDLGQIVGWSHTPAGPRHAVLWHNGTMTDLGVLPEHYDSEAADINNQGQIVGRSRYCDPLDDGDCALIRGVLWYNGTMTDLGEVPDTNDTVAKGINNVGQVIGWVGKCSPDECARTRGFLWQNNISTLNTLGGDLSEATDINDGGQIVGWSDMTNGQQRHAVLWNNGVVVDLGTLGGTTSEANAINKRGEVVGHSTKAQGFASYAWLWYRGEMIELGSLGGVSSYAVGINDQRQVVGQGLLPNGDSHAVLWTITPTHYTVYLPQLVQ